MEDVRRSWLLIPATEAEVIEAAWTFDADVVVLDLEDTVHDRRKPAAREVIREAISMVRKGGAEVFVRCDLELLYADLAASVWHGLQGVVLPKVETEAHVYEAEALLATFEAERGVRKAALVGVVDEADNPRGPGDALEIHLAFETGPGNYHAERLIAASRRVRSVSLGRADLVMDLRPEPSGELHFMPYLMQRLVTVAGACGVTPIGGWWQGNSRGLRADTAATLHAGELGRAAGFKGAMCVEPAQVAALNQGFTPSPDELAGATAEIEAYEQATAAGRIAGDCDGRTVDEAAARSARALLVWADACTARDEFKRHAVARAKHAS